ncbi:TPA: DUF3325 domain-containing protein [Klebsiella pneumoniae]|nr:DUF3325 domain-containing protein [Escherichia coli]EIY2760914.1 DUF3325 domain-containing protein [Klebsiella pneumoniae]EMC6787412.1 DUF3325 domain-containing protein [Escherichia coli]EME9711106.1 DUF3325 domain-containing protein [Klebsiella pneumoniae]HBQ5629543.1 DUF3325 domain-containing protein [Klebsiella pneumoniae]
MSKAYFACAVNLQCNRKIRALFGVPASIDKNQERTADIPPDKPMFSSTGCAIGAIMRATRASYKRLYGNHKFRAMLGSVSVSAALLITALVASWNSWGLSIAVTTWMGALTFGGLSMTMVLTYWLRWLPFMASVTFVGGVLVRGIKLVLTS